jgi:hypothetical protein
MGNEHAKGKGKYLELQRGSSASAMSESQIAAANAQKISNVFHLNVCSDGDNVQLKGFITVFNKIKIKCCLH